MKLVVLMCIEGYSEIARKLLRDVKVPAFSETAMSGYTLYDEDEATNWFAGKHNLDSSHIFFTMCDEKKAEEVLNAIGECKIKNNLNHVHAFQLAIEKFVN
jgi:hypothetical protein